MRSMVIFKTLKNNCQSCFFGFDLVSDFVDNLIKLTLAKFDAFALQILFDFGASVRSFFRCEQDTESCAGKCAAKCCNHNA